MTPTPPFTSTNGFSKLRQLENLPTALVGLDAIGAYFGRSRTTARRWIVDQDLPASRLPDDTWCTTPTLLDQWLLARRGNDGAAPAACARSRDTFSSEPDDQ